MFGAGSVIGWCSSVLGIGGGTLSVPFMVWCNVPVHEAIGTSAAIGFPIAFFGTLGYIYNGLHSANLPQYALGYVYLPALAAIIPTSFLAAKFGVRLAHHLQVDLLKRLFAVLLFIIALHIMGLF